MHTTLSESRFRYLNPPPSPIPGFRLPKIVPKPDLVNAQRLDLLPLPVITRMNRVGIAIDLDGLAVLSKSTMEREREARSKLLKFVPDDKLSMLVADPVEDDPDVEDVRSKIDININSGEQIADLLYRVLGLSDGRNIKTTNSGSRLSTGRQTLEFIKQDLKRLGEESGHVEALLQYRELVKLRTTYIDKFPRMAVWHDKGKCSKCGLTHARRHPRIHTTFGTTRAATGRLNSTNPNLQNIPIRTELGRSIRAQFVPEIENYQLLSADYSQIELRVLADTAIARNMMHAFETGLDIHSHTAMHAFGLKSIKDVTDEQRRPSKNVNFGIVYGLSARGLQAQLALMGMYKELEWCEDFISKYFKVHPEIKRYMAHEIRKADNFRFVWDLFGAVRMIPEVLSTEKSIVEAGYRQAGNFRIQASAAGLMKLALHYAFWGVKEFFNRIGYHFELLLTIHDEIVAEVDREIAKQAKALLLEAMESVCGLRVEIRADAKLMEWGWKK